MDVYVAFLLEKSVNSHCDCITEPEYSGEHPSLSSEVGKLANVLQSVYLTMFEWILLPIESAIQPYIYSHGL